MNALPLQWVLLCEDESDAELTTGLADRHAMEPHHGLEQWIRDNLDSYRKWVLNADEGQCWTWKRIKRVADRRKLTTHGYQKRAPGIETAEIRKAVLVISDRGHANPAGILMHRDTDGKTERREGFRRSVENYNRESLMEGGTRIILCLALPHPETEAWLLAAFEPKTESGRAALERERQKLGFDPRVHAERLNAGREATREGLEVKTSTKRILEELLCAEQISRESCWKERSLDILWERGGETGLREFFVHLERYFFKSLRMAAGLAVAPPNLG